MTNQTTPNPDGSDDERVQKAIDDVHDRKVRSATVSPASPDGLIDVTPKDHMHISKFDDPTRTCLECGLVGNPPLEAGCYHCNAPLKHDDKSGAYVCLNDNYVSSFRTTDGQRIDAVACPNFGNLTVVTNRSRETVVSEKP